MLGNNILQAKVTVGHALSARRCNSTVCLYRLNGDSVMEAKNSTAGWDQERNTLGANAWRNALCSSAALINSEYPANFASNFAMKRRRGVEGSNPLLLHHSVSRVSDIAENRSKSARVRAICDRARTRRTSLSGTIRQIGQFLSGRDFVRSADHRVPFACDF